MLQEKIKSESESQEEIKKPETKSESIPQTPEELEKYIIMLQNKLEEMKQASKIAAHTEILRVDKTIESLGIGSYEEADSVKEEVQKIENEKEAIIDKAGEQIQNSALQSSKQDKEAEEDEKLLNQRELLSRNEKRIFEKTEQERIQEELKIIEKRGNTYNDKEFFTKRLEELRKDFIEESFEREKKEELIQMQHFTDDQKAKLRDRIKVDLDEKFDDEYFRDRFLSERGETQILNKLHEMREEEKYKKEYLKSGVYGISEDEYIKHRKDEEREKEGKELEKLDAEFYDSLQRKISKNGFELPDVEKEDKLLFNHYMECPSGKESARFLLNTVASWHYNRPDKLDVEDIQYFETVKQRLANIRKIIYTIMEGEYSGKFSKEYLQKLHNAITEIDRQISVIDENAVLEENQIAKQNFEDKEEKEDFIQEESENYKEKKEETVELEKTEEKEQLVIADYKKREEAVATRYNPGFTSDDLEMPDDSFDKKITNEDGENIIKEELDDNQRIEKMIESQNLFFDNIINKETSLALYFKEISEKTFTDLLEKLNKLDKNNQIDVANMIREFDLMIGKIKNLEKEHFKAYNILIKNQEDLPDTRSRSLWFSFIDKKIDELSKKIYNLEIDQKLYVLEESLKKLKQMIK